MMEATQTAIDMIKCQVLSLFVWSLFVVVCRGGSILTPQAQTKQHPTECSVPKRATSVDSGKVAQQIEQLHPATAFTHSEEAGPAGLVSSVQNSAISKNNTHVLQGHSKHPQTHKQSTYGS
jgi:hypothetical protein